MIIINQTFACSDLHGDGTLWDMIKDFLSSNDKLFFLGDATDRGPDGWRILKEMIADPRIIYIAGNHDLMLADRIAYQNDYNKVNLHYSNGGRLTWIAAENDPDIRKVMLFIRKMPLWATYKNKNNLVIFMSHSGSTDIKNSHELVWDRNEYFTRFKPDKYDIVIHGHTTIPHLIKDLNHANKFLPEDRQYQIQDWQGGAYWYHNFRCDLDCCTAKTNKIVLLNLDTFEEKIFSH